MTDRREPAQPFRFTGEQQDPDVNRQLYYLRARYYDPAIGRFWSADPWLGAVHSPQSLNRYAYVSNRAVNFVDPWGLCGVSSWGDFGDCFEEPVRATGSRVGRDWEDFRRTISDPGVWKPIAGAGLIIVADVPGLALDAACVLGGAPSFGATCLAAEAYMVFVFLPATDLGICLITGKEFIIPGTQRICTHDSGKAPPQEGDRKE